MAAVALQCLAIDHKPDMAGPVEPIRMMHADPQMAIAERTVRGIGLLEALGREPLSLLERSVRHRDLAAARVFHRRPHEAATVDLAEDDRQLAEMIFGTLRAIVVFDAGGFAGVKICPEAVDRDGEVRISGDHERAS